MSKSLGNLVFVSDLATTYEPGAIRLAVEAHHYRDPWEWNDQMMPEAAERLSRWAAAGSGEGGIDEVRAALDEDLATHEAIAAIDRARGPPAWVSRSAPSCSAVYF